MTRESTEPDGAASAWRHVLSVLLLPTAVVAVVPAWILRSWSATDSRWPDVPLAFVGRIAGVLVFAAGLGLFLWCVVLFARVGRGTLAPWDPTQQLVAVGPYRYVRNPMISGVASMLVGEALMFGSKLIAGWSIVFIVVNHLHFLVSEEPGLQRRFGPAYVEYKRRVPRWIPWRLNRDRAASPQGGGFR